ncbi:hypothetical protein ABH926_004786 [Catenulispora sp. GP43]|uniref:hypothetical protein n=1 Tax=Catenulispora sp. GP43 TaxID=3156263 RepID=UPI00351644B1
MTEPSNLLAGQDPPPEPVVADDGTSRQPNRLDHMGFLLQLVQVAPMAMSLFGVFLSSAWALRVTTAATLAAGWVAITLLSHGRGGHLSHGRGGHLSHSRGGHRHESRTRGRGRCRGRGAFRKRGRDVADGER